MFTGEKIAQMAAFFADKQGGAIDTLKLVKLLYLSDREAIDCHKAPISYDRMVAMPHGPALSIAMNLVHGDINGQAADEWDRWIGESTHHQVALNQQAPRERLDQLSDQDIAILKKVWADFGHMDKWELRDYTHENLPEWRDPNGSSFPIGHLDLLKALGKTDDEAEAIANDLREQGELSALLSTI